MIGHERGGMFKHAIRGTLLALLVLAPLTLSLGGCGEGELFQKNNDIQSRSLYWPDSHAIEATHQSNYGSGFMPMNPGTPGQSGY